MGGLVVPKRTVWVVAAVTVFWIVLLLSDGSGDNAQLLVGAALGAVNAVVGAAVGRWIRWLISAK